MKSSTYLKFSAWLALAWALAAVAVFICMKTTLPDGQALGLTIIAGLCSAMAVVHGFYGIFKDTQPVSRASGAWRARPSVQ
jgi:hypothetical protein